MRFEWIALLLSATVFPIAVVLLVALLLRERREHRAALMEQTSAFQALAGSKPDATVLETLRALADHNVKIIEQGEQQITLLRNIVTSCGAGAIAKELAKGIGESAKISAAAAADAANRIMNGPTSMSPATLAQATPAQGTTNDAPATVRHTRSQPPPGDPVITVDGRPSEPDPEATRPIERLPALQSLPFVTPPRNPTLLGVGAANGASGADKGHPMEQTIRTSRFPAPRTPG